MLKHVLLAGLLSLSVGSSLNAQSCGNDEKYRLPYKNTYCLLYTSDAADE